MLTTKFSLTKFNTKLIVINQRYGTYAKRISSIFYYFLHQEF